MIYIIHQYLYIFNSKIDENKGVRNKMIIIGIDPGYAIVGIGGVLLVAVANKNVPISEYTPLQVKQSVTGYGRADKKQIQSMVKMILGLNVIPKPDDAADALALAICHAHSNKMNNMLGMNGVR